MVEDLKVSATTIFLSGISLKASFTISNPNDMLAISYNIEPIYSSSIDPDSQSKFSKLLIQVFPESGLILKKQKQVIMIKTRWRSEIDSESFPENIMKLKVNYNLNNNFNKLAIKNRRLKFIDNEKLEKWKGSFTIPVELSVDHMKIKEDIQNEVQFRQSLQKEVLDLSTIRGHEENKQNWDKDDRCDVCTIINSLQLNSRIKQNNLQQASYTSFNIPIKSANHQIQSLPLKDKEKQIKYQKVMRVKDIPKEKDRSTAKLEDIEQLDPFASLANIEYLQKCSYMTAKEQDFSSSAETVKKGCSTSRSLSKPRTREVDNLELLIFAVVAGFFYSLGVNFSKLLGG